MSKNQLIYIVDILEAQENLGIVFILSHSNFQFLFFKFSIVQSHKFYNILCITLNFIIYITIVIFWSYQLIMKLIKFTKTKNKCDNISFKVAIASENGLLIDEHFGRAPKFLIFNINKN